MGDRPAGACSASTLARVIVAIVVVAARAMVGLVMTVAEDRCGSELGGNEIDDNRGGFRGAESTSLAVALYPSDGDELVDRYESVDETVDSVSAPEPVSMYIF